MGNEQVRERIKSGYESNEGDASPSQASESEDVPESPVFDGPSPPEIDDGSTKSVENDTETMAMTKETDIRIGKRSATLYLSSHSLKSKPTGNENNTNAHKTVPSVLSKTPSLKSIPGFVRSPSSLAKAEAKNESKRTPSLLSSASTIRSQITQQICKKPLPKIEKEFTFTGYDIMKDVEPVEITPVDEIAETQRRQTYLNSCKRLQVIPCQAIMRQLNSPIMTLHSRPLGPKGAQSLAVALVNNDCVKSLDLEDNDLGAEGASALFQMLQKNDCIIDVNIAENLIGRDGLRAITDTMKVNTVIQSLDLTGSNFVDNDTYHLAEILKECPTLRELILSHNKIGEKGGYVLAQALAQNDSLRIINLSWNHIRSHGAKSMAACLQKNIGLRKMDLSWNGFTTSDCNIFRSVLKENTTLKELDLSHNQLGEKAVMLLMSGIQTSDGLEILRIGGNMIVPRVACMVVKFIASSATCRIHTLDLSETEVDEEFLALVDDIQAKQTFDIAYGNIIKRAESKVYKGDGIDGNLDGVFELFKYMHDNNYRVIDLMKWLDKDGSMSVSRSEFKHGMILAEVPLTEHQLDKLLDRLDQDGDGEVDFRELLIGERDFRRTLRRKQERMRANKARDAKLKKIVLASISEKDSGN